MNRQQTGRCPACGARLRVGHRQRTGTCGRCGVALGVRRGVAVAAARRAKIRETRGPHMGRNPARLAPSAERAIDSAAQKFETFHGRAPRVERLQYDPPKVAILMGDLAEFSYIPPADSERGKTETGRRIKWHHEMLDHGIPFLRLGWRPKVYVSESGDLVFVRGGSGHFDPNRGYVG